MSTAIIRWAPPSLPDPRDLHRLPVHDAAKLFPLLDSDEFEALVENVRANGLLFPVVICQLVDGWAVLDGRNRLRACEKADVTPTYETYDGDDPVGYVIGANAARRHLDKSQLAAIGVTVETMYAAGAAEEQRAQGHRGKEGGRGNRKENPAGTCAGRDRHDDESREMAARTLGISGRLLQVAKKVHAEGHPKLFEAVRDGVVAVKDAARVLDQPHDVQVRLLESVIRGAHGKLAHARHVYLRDQRDGETRRSPNRPVIRRQDAMEFLRALAEKSIDLLFTDPPYSTDVDDIATFAASWLPLALSRLKPTGRAYVCIGAYPAELLAYLTVARAAGWMPEQELVWTYRNLVGPTPTYDYKLNHQTILVWRGPLAQPLNCGSDLVEQFTVQDINAPDGRRGERYHPWQKPDELGERLVRHSTTVGQIVVDPFAGTGTFLLAAARLGRTAVGCDSDPNAVSIALRRGCIRAGKEARDATAAAE